MSTKELELRDEAEETFVGAAEELPEQGGGYTPTILPGIHFFTLPANIDQCWGAFDVELKDAQGNPVLDGDGKPRVRQELYLKFDRDNPLVCADTEGEYGGLPAGTITISTLGRKRGKKSDPNAPVVADMTYFLRTSLQDKTVIARKADWIPAVNKHAGEMIRIETGLRATCDTERVRYVADPNDPMRSIEDPEGTHGCGKKFYTQAFKARVWDEAAGREVSVPTDRIVCDQCGASLRGFIQVEKFLAPLGR